MMLYHIYITQPLTLIYSSHQGVDSDTAVVAASVYLVYKQHSVRMPISTGVE